MIPENYPEPQLMPTRLVQLPDNLTGCRPENGEYDRKKEEDPDRQEFVSLGIQNTKEVSIFILSIEIIKCGR